MSKKLSQPKASVKISNTPRQIRMPPVLDQWLEEKAAESGFLTVADKVRQIVAEAREAELRDQAAA